MNHSIITIILFFSFKELADDFYNTFNGQPYNLIEDEVILFLLQTFEVCAEQYIAIV